MTKHVLFSTIYLYCKLISGTINCLDHLSIYIKISLSHPCENWFPNWQFMNVTLKGAVLIESQLTSIEGYH